MENTNKTPSDPNLEESLQKIEQLVQKGRRLEAKLIRFSYTLEAEKPINKEAFDNYFGITRDSKNSADEVTINSFNE